MGGGVCACVVGSGTSLKNTPANTQTHPLTNVTYYFMFFKNIKTQDESSCNFFLHSFKKKRNQTFWKHLAQSWRLTPAGSMTVADVIIQVTWCPHWSPALCHQHEAKTWGTPSNIPGVSFSRVPFFFCNGASYSPLYSWSSLGTSPTPPVRGGG